MRRIYVSSTYEDLKAFRAAVCRTLRELRCEPLAMEDMVAADRRPLEVCLRDVAASDAYLGIFAWRRGYCPPGQDRAITELEWREARRLGRPCLMFLLADDAPWPATLVDEDRRPIGALRGEIRREHVVASFRTEDDLARAVATAVAGWLAQAGAGAAEDRHRVGSRGGREGRPAGADDGDDNLGLYRNCIGRFRDELARDIRFYTLVSSVLVGLALLVLGVAWGAFDGTERWLIAAGGVVLASSSPFPVVSLRATRKKKAVLDGYADELTKPHPALDAIRTARRFVEAQMAPSGTA